MTIDENAYKTIILNYVQQQKPDLEESKQQRLVEIAADVITMAEKMEPTTSGKKKWFSTDSIIFYLKEFHRVQPMDTDDDIRWVVEALWKLRRLAGGDKYYDEYKAEYVQKFVYNEYFRFNQPTKKEYKNPFE